MSAIRTRIAGWVCWTAAGIGWLFLATPRLIREWQSHVDYEHVWLVIPLLLFFGYAALRKAPLHSAICNTPDMPPNPNTAACATSAGNPIWGLGLILATAFFYIDWHLHDPFFLALGLWSAGVGACGLLFERQRFRALWFVFLLAMFLIPLPRMVTTQYLHLTLQHIAASSTAGLLSLTGISAHVTGSIITVDDSALNVAEACSGLKFMTVLILMALVAGHVMMPRAMTSRSILAAMAIPLAIVVNSLRLWVAGIILHRAGMEAADHFLHGWSVFLVYAVGMGAFMSLVWLMRSWQQLQGEEATCASAP